MNDQDLCLFVSGDGEPEWVLQHARDERRKDLVEKKRSMEDRLRKIRMEELRRTERRASKQPQSKKTVGDRPAMVQANG